MDIRCDKRALFLRQKENGSVLLGDMVLQIKQLTLINGQVTSCGLIQHKMPMLKGRKINVTVFSYSTSGCITSRGILNQLSFYLIIKSIYFSFNNWDSCSENLLSD